MLNELRAQLLEKRNKLSKEELIELNSLLRKNIREIGPLKEAKKIACYVSKGREVGTHSLINEWIKEGKEVYVPHTLWQNKMEFSRITNFEEMAEGKFGVLEPQQPSLPEQDIEVVIIPGAAFDKQGNRLGYGRGFFDRAVSSLKYLKNCVKIGLAYDFQVLDKLERKKWDLKVDYIITESKIIDCSNHS